MSEDTSNPVYKLIMDNLQLVLINVLIRSFFNTKVLQGSVQLQQGHLSCNGIMICHYTITAESEGEKFRKSVNICQSYGQLSTGSFSYETRCKIEQ